MNYQELHKSCQAIKHFLYNWNESYLLSTYEPITKILKMLYLPILN
jgi:hypothetical protein